MKLSIALLFLLSPFIHATTLYQCKDDDGETSFQDKPCQVETIKVSDVSTDVNAHSSAVGKAKVLMETVKEINSNLPIRIDNDTILFETSAVQNKFVYSYQLPNHKKADLDINAFVESMSPNINNSVCTNENMKEFRGMGVIISYSYFDVNMKQVTAIDVDTKRCPKT